MDDATINAYPTSLTVLLSLPTFIHSSLYYMQEIDHETPICIRKTKTRKHLHSTIMPIFLYTFITIFIIFLHYLILRIGKKTCEPTNWPLIGMLPTIIHNLHRAHDKITEVLCECGGTYYLRGPWLFDTDILFTSDPANIQHILNKNFANYPKGSEFMKKFEILGDGIFSADFEMWELQRRVILSLINHSKFHASLERSVWEKVENGLLPVLDHVSRQGNGVVDLQQVFQRFTFDNICQLVLHYDPVSLSPDFPYIPCEKAFSNALQPLMYRHVLPERMWRLQKWLNVGSEKKLTESWKAFDDFIYPRISLMEEEMEKSLDVFASFRKAYEENKDDNVVRFSGDLRRFLRDSLLGLLFAGRDTTSTCLTWLFWLIAVNPLAQTKILEEIQRELQVIYSIFYILLIVRLQLLLLLTHLKLIHLVLV